MYYVYILSSKKDQGYYIGYTGDLRKRFSEHQKGSVAATKGRRPAELFYYEAYRNESSARERERQLKKFGSSYQGLIKRIKGA